MRRLQQLFFSKRKLFNRVLAVMLIAVAMVAVFSLSAEAKNTYRITDGERVLIFSTDATNPVDVLNQAGLALGKDDTYTTQESSDYPEIHVRRIQMVTINNGGQILKTGTYGETVQQLLERMKISIGSEDTVSVDLSVQTHDGMEISISRKHYATETYSKTIPFETEYTYDESMPEGEEKIVTAGIDGESRIEEEVVYVNNEETDRRTLSDEVVREAVTQVVRVGTGTPDGQKGKLTIGDGIITTENGEVLTYTGVKNVVATAYSCEGWGRPGITATGTVARVGAIAVDPSVIPYGTRMFIVSNDGEYVYGVATAEDTGDPAYIGGNRIDLYFDTVAECVQFGARDCQVYILG